MSANQSPKPGDWKFQIPVKPRLTMYEEVGKNGPTVWGTYFDPARGKAGAAVTISTRISIRYPNGHPRAGRIWPEREQDVLRIAQSWHADLVAGRKPGARTPDDRRADADQEKAALSVRKGFKLYVDPAKGRYPNPADISRRDVIRAGDEAVAALGDDARWSDLVPIEAAQAIWRHVQHRFAEAKPRKRPKARSGRRNSSRRDHGTLIVNDGAVWAERVVQHFFACAAWLASRGHIPASACARPDDWMQEFKTDWRRMTGRDLDAEQEGLRFSAEEGGKLMRAIESLDVDPRLRINIYFGGDSLRAGQVRVARRSHLDLDAVGEFGLGRLTVPGSGKKKGSKVDLDPVVRAQIDYELSAGYLRHLEKAWKEGRIADYALMPQGRFVEGATPFRDNGRYLKSISKRTLLDYFHDLEELAGVAHVPGRGWYGLRRLWTDLGDEHVGGARARELLSGHARGSKVPDQVYKTKQDEVAIREAARGRALIREGLRQGKISEASALRADVVRAVNATSDVAVLREILTLLGAADDTSDDATEVAASRAGAPE